MTAADVLAHERLGITRDVLGQAQVRRVTDSDARAEGIRFNVADVGGIWYPRVDPWTRRVVGGRVRRDRPEMEDGKPRNKYLSTYGDRPHLYLSGTTAGDLADVSRPLVLVEAEKSALMLASVVPNVCPIATGGCWGWRGRIGRTETSDGARTDETGPCPDFDRIAWTGRDVVVWLDRNVETNTNVQTAERGLIAELVKRGARVRVARLPEDAPSSVNGADDYRGSKDGAAVRAVLDAAQPARFACESVADHLRAAGLDDVPDGTPVADLEPRLRRLADTVRDVDTLRHRLVRDSAIDVLKRAKVAGAAGLIDAALRRTAGEMPASQELVTDDVPAAEAVNGAELLDALADTVRRYVVLPTPDAADALALWIVLAWCEAAVSILPLLALASPTKRCGKTTTLTVIGALVPRGLSVSSITTAALFRAVDHWRPTLLIDEAETVLKPGENEDLRGVLNGGHTRQTARVIRCVGEDQVPTAFSTWCPKVLAYIGTMPDTIIDRSIVIALRRKTPDDPTPGRLRQDTIRDTCAPLRAQCRRWADDHAGALSRAEPSLPERLHDRAADNWRAMAGIADLAGGTWPARARTAAAALAGADDEEPSLGVLALSDIRDVWPANAPHVASAVLVEKLKAVEERPWQASGRDGRPLAGVGLARLLRPFKVKTSKVREGATTVNAYLWNDDRPGLIGVREALERYAPTTPLPDSEQRNTPTARSTNRHLDLERGINHVPSGEREDRLQQIDVFRCSDSVYPPLEDATTEDADDALIA